MDLSEVGINRRISGGASPSPTDRRYVPAMSVGADTIRPSVRFYPALAADMRSRVVGRDALSKSAGGGFAAKAGRNL